MPSPPSPDSGIMRVGGPSAPDVLPVETPHDPIALRTAAGEGRRGENRRIW
jgi:hypothetical protein